MSDDLTTLLLCARVRPGSEPAFAQWQVRWQTAVLAVAGAVSVEFWPPAPPDQMEVVALARFNSVAAFANGGAASAIASSSTRPRRWSKAAW